MTEKEWHTLYDGSGSDLDIALHNRETNEYVWVVESAIYQSKGIEKVCDKINELNDEYWILQGKYYKLKHYHSNLHDELCDVEVERDGLKKDVESLEKENKLLKKELETMAKKNKQLCLAQKKLKKKSEEDEEEFYDYGQMHITSMNLCE